MIKAEATLATNEAEQKKGKEKKVPSLTLDSFVMYKRDDSSKTGFTIFPEPRAVAQRGGRMVLTLGDVPLPEGVPHPKNALTCLYGFRDALEEMQRQIQVARSEGMSLIKASFDLEVGNIVMGTTNFDSLPTTSFLNLRRLKEEIAQVVLDGVNELLAQESAKNKKIQVFERMLDAGQRPDLICDVIRKEKMFNHIKAVAYLVPDGTRRGRQVATIFTDKVTRLQFRGDMPFDIELPKIR